MPKAMLILSVVIQVIAQAVGGIWGAAVGGLVLGLLWRRRGAFRAAFLGAAVAAALLLAVIGVRGGDVLGLAGMLGGNFKLPGWGVLAATLLFPALQAGGLGGGVSRLLRDERATG